jgi:hypothetical protein
MAAARGWPYTPATMNLTLLLTVLISTSGHSPGAVASDSLALRRVWADDMHG